MKLKISIIVPVYKVESYLKRCIDSIINQSYKNIEIILINDGSPDNCGRICDDYLKIDPRIIVIHQKNTGLSGARNSGLKMATGDYIGFVDSDDWIESNMFEIMLKTMINYKADIIECGLIRTTDIDNSIDRNGNIIEETRIEALNRIIQNQDFSVWRRLYPKNLIKNLEFVEGKNSEDVYFTINTFKSISKCIYMSHPLYNYFVGGESITRGSYSLKVLDTLDAALYLKEKINSEESDVSIKHTTKKFMLDVLLYNYKLLNYNVQFDQDFIHRKHIRRLIKENFISNSIFQLRMAKILPIWLFNLGINFKSKFRR